MDGAQGVRLASFRYGNLGGLEKLGESGIDKGREGHLILAQLAEQRAEDMFSTSKFVVLGFQG